MNVLFIQCVPTIISISTFLAEIVCTKYCGMLNFHSCQKLNAYQLSLEIKDNFEEMVCIFKVQISTF